MSCDTITTATNRWRVLAAIFKPGSTISAAARDKRSITFFRTCGTETAGGVSRLGRRSWSCVCTPCWTGRPERAVASLLKGREEY
jgi:hypothetical protein